MNDTRMDANTPAGAWSSLVDGECDAAVAAEAARQWRNEPQLRAAWYAYHLIGDALRSDDLARTGGADDAFMQRLRARLQDEPIVLAPQPLAPIATQDQHTVSGRNPMLRRWATPVGIAAAIALVAGTLTATRSSTTGDGATFAQVSTSASEATLADARPVGKMLRDPELDRYLAAHKEFQAANALGPTPGFIRSATYDAAAR